MTTSNSSRDRSVCPALRKTIWVLVLFSGVVMTAVAETSDPLDRLEDALRRGRVPEHAITGILEAVADLEWTDLEEGADMDAVAFSLAYAERENRLPETASERALFTQDLTRVAAELGSAGFSKREVARILVAGVRGRSGPDVLPLSAATRREAARTMRDEARQNAREAARRRNEGRPPAPAALGGPTATGPPDQPETPQPDIPDPGGPPD